MLGLMIITQVSQTQFGRQLSVTTATIYRRTCQQLQRSHSLTLITL